MKKSIHLIIFFISMAMLESAVVIYLRELLYPHGFKFPLVGMKPIVILTELVRELATVIMLWTVGYIAGRNFATRFAWFIIGFGIWDIFYYLFLYIFIQWPSSLFEWDILFLIPLPWYGPVIAPCLISLAMIIFGWIILRLDKELQRIQWKMNTCILFIIGCFLGLASFMEDFIRTLTLENSISFSKNIVEHSQRFVPHNYNYNLFGLTTIFFALGIVLFYKHNESKSSNNII